MTSPDRPADSSARDSAIKLVEEALKGGRIIQADHDLRVGQLRTARTMQDIDLVVRDLRVASAAASATASATASAGAAAPAVSAVAPAPPQSGQPWPLVNYGPGVADSASPAVTLAKSGGRAIGGIIAAVVMVSIVVPIAGAVIAFVSSRDSFDFGALAPTDDTTYLPGQEPREGGINVHTVNGFDDLVEALREETGDAFAYSAVLYPRYAVLDVPLGTNNRYQSYYWDGDLSAQNVKGTSTYEVFDLSLVDPAQMVEMLTTVRDRIDRPESWYVIVSDRAGTDATIAAYASNEFRETTYIVQTLNGTLVYDSEQPG